MKKYLIKIGLSTNSNNYWNFYQPHAILNDNIIGNVLAVAFE